MITSRVYGAVNNMGKRKNRQKKQAKKKKMKEMKKMSKENNTWVSKQSCHTGHNLIFKTTDGIEVWAGGRNRNGGWHLMNPLPQLAIAPSETLGAKLLDSGTDVPEGWSCQQHLTNGTPPLFVSLDWPDFSIPKVSKYFWYALVDDIHEHNIKVISTQCAGGHGRTGTQLAILAHLLLPTEQHTWKDAGELIDWVREQHCVHAVEAKSQQEYIAEVCDIPHGESKIHASSWGFGGHTTVYDPPNYKVADKGKDIDGFDFDADYLQEDDYDYCNDCDDLTYDWFEKECINPKCSLNKESKKDTKKDTKIHCPACNEMKPSSNYVDDAKECLECLSSHFGIDTRGKGNATKYQCGVCKDYFSAKNIVDFSSTFNDFVCMKCQEDKGMIA